MITLSQIVRNLLSDEGRNTTHEYVRYLNIANRGLKELTFDILGALKVDLIQVDSSLRMDLPDDFEDYTFIGIIDAAGRLRPLGHRNNIPLVGDKNTLTPQTSTESYLEDGIVGMGGIYGNGGGQNINGYYSPIIDLENNQMIFTSVAVGKWIYIEYISDGLNATGDMSENVVHPYAEEALMSYIHWKSIQRRRSATQYDKESARRDWYNEKRQARSRLKAFTKEEALQVIRKGFKQAPKA